MPSCPFVKKAYEINRRIVFISRLLGIGREGLNLLYGLMDIGQRLNKGTYDAAAKNIYTAPSAVFNIFNKKALNEEKEKNLENGKPADEKSKCVGHVQKRIGSCLRNKKKTEKLGGKGKLTDSLIKDLTIYYGLVIRRNSHFVDEMRKAILATFYHKCSTNEKPQHMSYPPRANSWCKLRRVEAINNLSEFNHDPSLHVETQKVIKPVYEDLSSENLLERCLSGHNQNNNKCLNSIIWRFAPKHLHTGSKTIESYAYLAAGIFNDGFITILKVMETMDIIIGQQCKMFADCAYERRLARAEIKIA
ncbi:hypothetical protein ALC57_08557 [Trachymyrmex cornetzi]|uniref:Mutator-like transposase domain-containing protein n=1 Tax=Trachymyrmex cornetzi TaxID=471704 RepID=A0A151J708_9HYME|nr:hypothetical protein ALC57_08557 [Trachymyrmex cornetzi]